jgi:iron-sulfur cluster repair protein YtfE (RIC family)
MTDAIDRLINKGYSSSDVETLNNSIAVLQKEFFLLCENEEAYVFPFINDEKGSEYIELLKKEHLQIQEILRSVKSSIDSINSTLFDKILLTELRHAVKSLGSNICSHLKSEIKLFPKAEKKFMLIKFNKLV